MSSQIDFQSAFDDYDFGSSSSRSDTSSISFSSVKVLYIDVHHYKGVTNFGVCVCVLAHNILAMER